MLYGYAYAMAETSSSECNYRSSSDHPVAREMMKDSLNEAYRIRRIYRRLAKMRGRGRLCQLTVIVRHENVVRLLAFLGYRQEE